MSHLTKRLQLVFFKYNETVEFICEGFGRYQTVLFWTHNKLLVNSDEYDVNKDCKDGKTYSSLSVQITALKDYGEYCCIISNNIADDSSCMSIYLFPTDKLSLGDLQRIVFITLSITTALLIIFTPGMFIHRLIKNVIC